MAYLTLEIQRLMITSDSECAFGTLQYLRNEAHPVKRHCKQPEQRGVKVEKCSLREEEASCLSTAVKYTGPYLRGSNLQAPSAPQQTQGSAPAVLQDLSNPLCCLQKD